MTRTLMFLLALAPAATAHAQAVQIKPLGEARLRFEAVDQDGLAANAEAHAHYNADGFAPDTDKFWLQPDWTL